MSIRLRLTLLYTALLVLVLVGFSTALYVGHSKRAVNLIEVGVAGAAEHMALRGATVPWSDGPHAENAPPTGKALWPRPERARPPVNYFQALRPDGSVADKATGLGDAEIPLSEEGLAAALAGRTWTEHATLDDERFLIVSAPVIRDGEVAGIVQAAGSMAMVEQYLHGLRASLLLIVGITVIVAFASGWWLAGAVLRPIDRITRTAREIGDDRDFSRRVLHSGPDDELGQLASTFNDMLSALQDAYDSVAEALHRQQAFVADASHELRTPLTTIRGNSELLRRDPPINDDDHCAVVSDIVSETERLMGLVDELLILARSDANRQLEVGPVSLAPLLDDLLRQMTLIEPDRLVTVAPGNGYVAIGNGAALKQVLLNLVENALKHTPPDTEVEVAVTTTNGCVAIRVRDSGPGIDPAHLPHLFERFHRGDTARTSPGSGLGLAIAKTLTESQGGTLEVDTALGNGTTFNVMLPALPE
jgi:signal transduction histidine kinase